MSLNESKALINFKKDSICAENGPKRAQMSKPIN